MEYTKKQIPIHKGATTYYGKGFLQSKKYDEVGKYYPKKGEMVSMDPNLPRNKFQTTDSLFFAHTQNKPNKNNYYTTSTNFANRRPYDNGPFTAHRIKEATPEIDEDVFDMFDDQKNKTTSKTENEIMAGLRQTKYKQRPNSSRVTKRSHLNTANGKRNEMKTVQNEVGMGNAEDFEDETTCHNDVVESKDKGTRSLNNKVKEQILKGREFEEDKELEKNKRLTNTAEVKSRKTAPNPR